jgi:hypothetical protein
VTDAGSVALIGRTIADTATTNRRTALFGALTEWDVLLDPAANESLAGYAAAVDALFTSPPLTTAPEG